MNAQATVRACCFLQVATCLLLGVVLAALGSATALTLFLFAGMWLVFIYKVRKWEWDERGKGPAVTDTSTPRLLLLLLQCKAQMELVGKLFGVTGAALTEVRARRRAHPNAAPVVTRTPAEPAPVLGDTLPGHRRGGVRRAGGGDDGVRVPRR